MRAEQIRIPFRHWMMSALLFAARNPSHPRVDYSMRM